MAGKNTVVKEVRIGQLFPDMTNLMGALATMKQGELVIFDSTSKVLRAATAESELSTLVGIAAVDVTAGVVASPYTTDVDAAQGTPALPGPLFGMTARFILTTGVNLAKGEVMYGQPASGARYVMPIGSGAASGTKAIGIYQGGTVTSSAAGLEVEVLLGCRYPDDTLKF